MHVYARLCVASSTNHLLLPSPCSDQHAAAAATISFRCMRGKLELHEGVCVCRACKRKSLMQHCIRLCVCVCVHMCTQFSCEKCAKFTRFLHEKRVKFIAISVRKTHKVCAFFARKTCKVYALLHENRVKFTTIFRGKNAQSLRYLRAKIV